MWNISMQGYTFSCMKKNDSNTYFVPYGLCPANYRIGLVSWAKFEIRTLCSTVMIVMKYWHTSKVIYYYHNVKLKDSYLLECNTPHRNNKLHYSEKQKIKMRNQITRHHKVQGTKIRCLKGKHLMMACHTCLW